MITKRTNSKNYYSEFTLNGQKYIKSTKTTDKKLATKIDLEYYKQAVEQSKLVGKSISLKEGLKLHHDYSKDNNAYQKSVVSVINWLNDNFDTNLPMTRIDNKFLYQFVNKRGLESKPSIVKHNLGVITRTIKLCKKLGYDVCSAEPPTVKVKNTKTRVLTKSEETKLLESFLVDKGAKRRAKLSRVLGKRALKSFHPRLFNDRLFAGESWRDKNGCDTRNQATAFC